MAALDSTMSEGLLERSNVQVFPRTHFLLTRGFDVVSGNEFLGSILGSSTRLELKDYTDQPLAVFERPWVIMLTQVAVARPNGEPLGAVRQVTPFGRIRFEFLDPSGNREAVLEPDGYGAHTLKMLDRTGREFGLITRQWRWLWRTGDYSLSLSGRSDRWMILGLAAIIAVDKAVHRRRANGSAAPAGAG